MKSFLVIALVAVASLFLYSPVDSAPAAKGQRLRLKVIKHQPCTSRPTASERIRFPSLADAPLKPDPSKGEGCYILQGPVKVHKKISGTVQILSQVRFSTKGDPEPCQKYDSNGCGGVGSCVYCDVCQNAKTIEKKSSGLVHLTTTDGSSLDCKNGVKAGNYNNIKVSFCLPTKEDVLSSQSIDEKFFDEYAANGRMFFIELKIVNQAVNKWSAKQLQNISNDKVIGCHKIVGTVYDE